MIRYLPFVMLAGLLTACTHHYHPLAADKKAKLVSELVLTNEECKAFGRQLASPDVDDDGVDDIYHAAQKAHCIKKDV